MKKTLTLAFFLVTILGPGVYAQNLFSCGTPPPPGSPSCLFSCIYCDLNGLEDTNIGGGANNEDICAGAITVNSSRWYGFIAATPNLLLAIKPSSCSGTDGLQAAIVEDCGKTSSVVCNPGAAGNGTTPIIIGSGGLKVGARYQLVIDGFDANDLCRYSIEILAGSVTPPPVGPVGPIQGLTQVCPGATLNYSIPSVANALTYTWTAPPGSKIDGGTNVKTIINNGDGGSVSIQFGQVGGSVCVTAANPCNPPVTVCLPIVNQALTPTILPDLTICNEELPYEWPEEPFNLLGIPGTYNLTSTAYDSYLGCDSVVKQKIIVLPRKQKTLPLTFLCRDECIMIGDFPFCNSGTYQEILSAANGCDSTVNFTIVKIPVKAVAQKPDTLTCNRTSVTLTSTGSTTGNTVSYKWINSAGQSVSVGQTAVVSTPGNYSLIVTNVGGGRFCRDTAVVTVIAATTPPLSNAGPAKILTCTLTQVQLQGTGSTGGQYAYFWTASNGGNIVSGTATLTPTVNAAGTYTLRVTNTHTGCTSTASTTVTVTTVPPGITVAGGTFTCETPSVTLQATTTAVNPTFAWTGPNGFVSAAQNPVVNAAGVYTLKVTDGPTGCTATATATVIANNLPPGATAVGGTLTCSDTSVTLSGSSGTPNVTYAWTGPNGFASTLPNPVVTAVGIYSLQVTGANFCTSTATANVALNNTAPGATLAAPGNLNCNTAEVNLVVSSTAGPAGLEHLWTRPDNTTISTGSSPLLVVSQAGAYSVLVTNTANGCTSTANITVVRSPNVTVTIATPQNAACFGSANGSLTATAGGGNGTLSYEWNTGATTGTISNLVAGIYTVTVTDVENCTATSFSAISQPALLQANAAATAQTSNGASDGTATANPAGGTSPYSYNWSNGQTTQSITGLLPGSYTVTVTDANNCTAVQTATVNAFNCAIQAGVVPVNISCNGANNGSATLTVDGGNLPLTYAWSTGSSNDTVVGLAPGQYSVTVTDANNCPVQLTFSIAQPNALTVNATAVNSSGPNANNGSATAGPTGGTGNYLYAWSNGAVTATINNLAADIYTVTVTDGNGCTAVQSVEVAVEDCAVITGFLPVNPSCNGLANGKATAVVTGGNAPFTFVWSSGGMNALETNLSAGQYIVSITDVNGCQVTDTVTLTEPPVLSVSLDTIVKASCIFKPDGSATVTAAGGTGNLSFDWSDGQTGATATNLAPDTYTVVVTDDNDCSVTLTVVVDAFDQQAPVITAGPATLSLGPAGIVAVTLQTLGAQVSDNCSVGDVTIVPTSFNCTQQGQHDVTITVTDDTGNSTSSTIVVTVVDNTAPVLDCPASITRCFGNTLVQYDAPTAIENCFVTGGNFEQTSGLPSGSQFPVGITANTYTYTDVAGNAGSCSFEVNILSQVTVNIVNITHDIDNQNIGSIDITANGGLSPYTFQWKKNGVDLGITTEDLTGIGAGNYTVVVKDAFGCEINSQTINVTSMVDTDEPDWALGFSIRPNPTSGHVFIVFPEELNESVQLTLFDLVGRQLIQQNAQTQQLDLDLSALPEGMYTLMLRISAQHIVRKIVVSRP